MLDGVVVGVNGQITLPKIIFFGKQENFHFKDLR